MLRIAAAELQAESPDETQAVELESEAAAGVEEGGRALRDSDYPWYDPKADDLRPIEFKKDPPDKVEKTKPVEELEYNSGAVDMIAWVVLGLLVAAVLFFVIRAFMYGDFTTAGDKVKKSGTRAASFDALPVAAVTAKTDLLSEAQRLYEQGDYANAMIYLYSHLLLRLDRGQLIRLARGKTNRQYLREIGQRPIRDIFQSAMWAFEDAFFGRRALSRERFETEWQRLDEFHRLVDASVASMDGAALV